MKALLTGSSGFLGAVILNQLKQNGWKVFTLGRRKDSTFRVNLTESFQLNSDQRFTHVIHCAGKAHVRPRTKLEEKDFFTVNVAGTEHLLNALGKTDVLPESFILISSVAVYGRVSGNMISETESLNATDPYGRSKIEEELLVREWCNSKGIRLTILRLPLVVGKDAPGNLKAMVEGITRGRYLNISGGLARKSMVLAADVATLIATPGLQPGTYNLTDRKHPSFAELSQNIAGQLGKKAPANIPHWIAIVAAKLGDILGHKFPVNSK
ncbi:MAG: NAD-dependent epimerase/dehydratase family protein, partial [Pedobacter sp.]